MKTSVWADERREEAEGDPRAGRMKSLKLLLFTSTGKFPSSTWRSVSSTSGLNPWEDFNEMRKWTGSRTSVYRFYCELIEVPYFTETLNLLLIGTSRISNLNRTLGNRFASVTLWSFILSWFSPVTSQVTKLCFFLLYYFTWNSFYLHIWGLIKCEIKQHGSCL